MIVDEGTGNEGANIATSVRVAASMKALHDEEGDGASSGSQ